MSGPSIHQSTNNAEFIKQLLALLPQETREAVKKDALIATKGMRWCPNFGPQLMAFNSKADQLFYGGEIGGGKTDVILGLATERHKRSLVMRRLTKEVEVLVERADAILGLNRVGYNGQKGIWRLPNNQRIQFGGCQNAGDEVGYKGDRKDFIALDEASEFLESQVQFLIGWLGSADAAQHCQLLLASNPPGTAEGQWLVRWFAPWLDRTHPLFPTEDGKLLWCMAEPGSDPQRYVWRDEPWEAEINGRTVRALSRTFIRSGLKDNPDYANSGYAERVGNMPELLRRRYVEGDFTAGMVDHERQLIPTAWVIAAQERWRPDGGKAEAMTAMALDPAGGGRDSAEIAGRHGGWYAELVSAKGADTADGSMTAATVTRYRRNGAPIVVDVGGGYGGGVIIRFNDNQIPFVKYNGANASTAKTRDGALGFFNKRAECWWKFMEELDPDQEGGSVIALPPDSELLGDLVAPRYEVRAKGILLEDKDEIRKRLGRSPGKGDAVVMAMSEGSKARMRMASRYGYSAHEHGITEINTRPQVIMGRQAVRQGIGRR